MGSKIDAAEQGDDCKHVSLNRLLLWGCGVHFSVMLHRAIDNGVEELVGILLSFFLNPFAGSAARFLIFGQGYAAILCR